MYSLIKIQAAQEKPFTEEEIRGYFLATCKAIRFLHSMKVVHRDLKPQNILLTQDYRVKVSDFATVIMFQEEKLLDDFPYYKSPELFEGSPYSKSSDIWALGCILYELCYLEVYLI